MTMNRTKVQAPNAEGVWGTGVPQRGPGAEPLVGAWGQSPQKLYYQIKFEI